MIDPNAATVHYIQANKKQQRIGVQVGRKVIHFNTTLDEVFAVGDEMVLTLTRKPLEANPLA